MKKHLKILGITTVLFVTMGLIVGASTALAAKGGNVIGPGGSHTIVNPGNYKVVGTIQGIDVQASNVHINLSEGTVDCQSSIDGISVINRTNVHVNASLTGRVENCLSGIFLSGGGNHHINGVILRSNSASGIRIILGSTNNHINGNDSSFNDQTVVGGGTGGTWDLGW